MFSLKKKISSNYYYSPETLKAKRDWTTGFLCHPVNNELCNTNTPIMEAENISKVRFFLRMLCLSF